MFNRHRQFILICAYVLAIGACKPSDANLRPILKIWECDSPSNKTDFVGAVEKFSNEREYILQKSKLLYGENGEVVSLQKKELTIDLIVLEENVKVIATTKGRNILYYETETSKFVKSLALNNCENINSVAKLN